jgi:hypothetical protein
MFRNSIVAFILATTPVNAAVVHHVHDRPGGNILDHVTEFSEWDKNGDQVIVDGMCASACTLLLKLPHLQICATDDGSFGFHSASIDGHYSRVATLYLQFSYPYRVNVALQHAGWNVESEHDDPIFIPATALVRRCV